MVFLLSFCNQKLNLIVQIETKNTNKSLFQVNILNIMTNEN